MVEIISKSHFYSSRDIVGFEITDYIGTHRGLITPITSIKKNGNVTFVPLTVTGGDFFPVRVLNPYPYQKSVNRNINDVVKILRGWNDESSFYIFDSMKEFAEWMFKCNG